jgi:hypothetical protein
MCYLPKTKGHLQVNATGRGSTEQKRKARSRLLDLCQYDACDAIVETQPVEGQQQKRKLSELAVTPDVSKALNKLQHGALTSLSNVLKVQQGSSSIYMHLGSDQESNILKQDQREWPHLVNVHNTLKRHFSGEAPLDLSNRRALVENATAMCCMLLCMIVSN